MRMAPWRVSSRLWVVLAISLALNAYFFLSNHNPTVVAPEDVQRRSQDTLRRLDVGGDKDPATPATPPLQDTGGGSRHSGSRREPAAPQVEVKIQHGSEHSSNINSNRDQNSEQSASRKDPEKNKDAAHKNAKQQEAPGAGGKQQARAQARWTEEPPQQQVESDDDDTQAAIQHQKALETDDDDPSAQQQPEPEDKAGKQGQRKQGGDGGGDGDDDNDEDAGDDWGDKSTFDQLPYRNLLNQRTPRVLVFVITGGKKESVKTNRKAVLDTWFDKDTYFVTREDVPTQNVVRLSEYAESGGHRGLPRKVKHMFQYMYEHFLEDYDWFVKADDDTYINMPRFRKMLSAYNPNIPVYLGKPFSTKTKGVDGPSPLWRDFTTVGFCHGGAGYVMSRELLRIVGPHFIDSPSTTALEDAAISSVLYQHAAVRCINTNARMFGGLDLVHNSHDQDLIIRTLQKYEKREPMTLIKTSTIHSVKANATFFIHDLYQRLYENPSLVEQTDALAERDLEARRWQMVTSWNCTIPTPAPDQVDLDAICQQSALASTPPVRPRHMKGLDNAITEVDGYAPCPPSVDGASATRGATAAVLAFARLSGVRDAATEPSGRSSALGGEGAQQAGRSKNVAMVPVDSHDEQALAALALFIRSLRAVGSDSNIAVFTPNRDWVRAAVAGKCGVQVVEYDNAKVVEAFQDQYNTKPTEDQIFFALFETYLHRHEERYDLALHARVDTFFQRNPFSTVPTRKGLVLFVDNPVVTRDQVECFSGYLRINEKATKLTLQVSMGVTSALRDFYARSVQPFGRARKCAFDALVMLNTFRKVYAQDSPVLIVTPWDGALARLSIDQEHGYSNGTDAATRGRIVYRNVKGVASSIVTGYMNLLEFDEAGLLVVPPPDTRKTRVQLALETLPKRLHDPVLHSCTFKDPSHEEWPLDSKAFLRWSGLMGVSSQAFDLNTFRPVWELLAQYRTYWGDTAKPAVRKLAGPATHRTGASILSSIYFRFAARHHLRMRHVGSWPFLPSEEINGLDPDIKGQYDVSLSQISPKGMWHSEFERASTYYNHLLGPDHKMTILFEEPSQHYLNWLYFYIIPKTRKKKPMQVLDEFLSHRFNRNLQMQELAVRTEQQWRDFVENHLPKFQLILLRERLDECLVLLRRMFNWSILDITYLKPVETGRRFDGKFLSRVPRVKTLDESVQEAVRKLLPLDYRMWELANKRLDELIAQQPPDFKDEVIAFQKVQSTLAEVCKSHRDHALCRWYSLSEYDIIGMIGPTGYTKAIPLL